ncbi:dihydrodiol dehydrogenase 3-like isoform X2 [Tachyglossus aculeatus]|uniref:dihydrodiol dehydrogenase 3-like isoform X2 n=1 Tax=Tachyglossus aculeatus TaxID=9261 RepID=UPI0018F364D0|nr:dihydrodiol dehydrogenase 3-like isoform X2 [Tachyglossus aculeatus]
MDFDRNYRVKLNDGNRIPVLGFGTSVISPDENMKSEEIIKVAIEGGFRHFDGALVYGNEGAVGKAFRAKMADGTVKREDIFYTGKLWSTYHRPELVRKGLEQSLKYLQLDYLDLFIIHYPYSFKPGGEFLSLDGNKKPTPDDVELRTTREKPV